MEQQEMFNDQLNEWDEVEPSDISVEDLDKAAVEYANAREIYDVKRATANEAHREMERKKTRLITLLSYAKKKRYSVEGVGDMTVVEKMKVKTPKDIEDKRKMFDWIEERFGEEGMYNFASINHNSLNSLYNEVSEEFAAKGEIFEMPGVGQPESEKTLQLRRK